MTRDAFYKAQEIEKKLDAVHQMQNILTNSTLAEDDEYFRAHNNHVKHDDMVLCYMWRNDRPDTDVHHIRNSYGDIIDGQFTVGGNFMFGRDVPLELVKRLEKTIVEYEEELNQEFKNLSGDYIEDNDYS